MVRVLLLRDSNKKKNNEHEKYLQDVIDCCEEKGNKAGEN